MSACVLLHRFERSLPARGHEPRSHTPARLGLRAASGGDRRVTGTPFDAQ